MFDLFQERRVFLNSKKKPLVKNILPQLKNSPNSLHKFNDDLFFPPNNMKLVYNYQPLSNILVSKKITPPNPQQLTLLIAKKKPVQSLNIHNFKIRKGSAKKITDSHERQSSTERHNSTSMSKRRDERVEQEDMKGKRVIASEKTFAVFGTNNNEQLVRQILSLRKQWREVGPLQVPNFKWVFSKEKVNFKKLANFNKKRIINHFEFNEEISTKDNLVRNLMLYCETKKMQVFTVTPLTFVIDFDDQYCQYHLKQFLNFFQKNDPRAAPKKNLNLNLVGRMQPYMAWQNSQVKKRVNNLSKPITNPTYFSQSSYLWFLKPTGLNRGRGIQIFDSLEQLEKILLDMLTQMNRKKFNQKIAEKGKTGQKKQKVFERCSEKEKDLDGTSKSISLSPEKKSDFIISEGLLADSAEEREQLKEEGYGSSANDVKFESYKLKACSFVIQKYVQRPFLINDRKFDIRVWALLTESMNIYFFKEGYIRTSAEIFSTTDINNYFIHLTNNAIQKYSDNYGQFEDGNQLPFRELTQYMSEEEVTRIWDKIKAFTYMAFSSIKKKINPNHRKHCFQLFGLDYIIDSQKKVWLIQVNQNPCLECSSPLLGDIVPRMINDAFKLTIDPLLGMRPEGKTFSVKGYEDNENLWQNLGQLIPNSQYSPKKQ